jgi:type II secretory pathway component PulJ
MSRKSGMTLTELAITVGLASVILLVILNIISGSQKNYTIGTNLMNTQLMMEKILMNLNSDFKRMTRLNFVEPNKQISMTILDFNGEERVTYKFNAQAKELVRITKDQSGEIVRNSFQSANMIDSVKFLKIGKVLKRGIEWPEHINIALRIIPSTQKSKVSFSVVTQFYPKAIIETPLKIMLRQSASR